MIFVAKYKNNVKGPTKVTADDVESAKKAAFAAYTFHANNSYPGPRIDDVVACIELADDQIVDGTGIQPCVTLDGYIRPTCNEIIRKQFNGNNEK